MELLVDKIYLLSIFMIGEFFLLLAYVSSNKKLRHRLEATEKNRRCFNWLIHSRQNQFAIFLISFLACYNVFGTFLEFFYIYKGEYDIGTILIVNAIVAFLVCFFPLFAFKLAIVESVLTWVVANILNDLKTTPISNFYYTYEIAGILWVILWIVLLVGKTKYKEESNPG